MRGITITPYAPYLALVLLLSACATMTLNRRFDSGDVAREWQIQWNRDAWNAPKNATVTGVTDLSCKKASEHRHALWCDFNLHYASAGIASTLPVERWLVDQDMLTTMESLRSK